MSNRLKWLIIAGARPNFMKIAPLIKAIKQYNTNKKVDNPIIIPLLVHTGQHYDKEMSKVFFDELNIPKPDINLGIGSGGHGEQTGRIMIAFEKVVLEQKPDLVVVVGDVNSTIACAMVATKLNIHVAHVEAGLRAFDRSMPEEINRILTDQISDYLFTHSPDANENPLKEGIPKEKIFFVGNIMIDSLMLISQYTSNTEIFMKLKGILPQKNEDKGVYALMTLHRPSNVDDKKILERVLDCLVEISKEIPILFPVHPRTKKQIEDFGLEDNLTWLNEGFRPINGRAGNHFYALPPLGYIDFMALEKRAKVMFTDSGGTQEETTILGVPYITLRENTERPVTITEGTNVIVGNVPENIKNAFEDVISKKQIEKKIPKFWDGKTAERIINVLTS